MLSASLPATMTITALVTNRPFIMHWKVLPMKFKGAIKGWIAIQRETSGL